MTLASQVIAEDRKQAQGLSARPVPEVQSDAATGGVPHGKPIRTDLPRDLGADSVFCVQDVPVAVFLAADASPADIPPLHSSRWNQGLGVLAIVCGDATRIYLLAAFPPDWHHDHLDDHRLINGPNKVADAVKCAAASICFILYRYLATQGDTDV